MSAIPPTPDAFFRDYLPVRVASLSGVLGGKSSPGSLLFDVQGAGQYWLRLQAGKLEVGQSALPDHLLSVALRSSDFERVIVAAAERVGDSLPPEQQLMAAKLLTLDAERAALVRGVEGSLGLLMADGDVTRRLLIAPAGVSLDIDNPTCDVTCSLDDFFKLQSGEANAFELLMDGRVRFGGDAQIAMALSGIFT